MDAMQQHALKQADPKYKQFTTKIQSAHRARSRTNTQQCVTMRQIVNLQASLDLTRRKSWDFEDTSGEVDKVLEDKTGEDGESWFWTYHNAGEEIEKLMIQKCIKVANLAAQYDMFTEQIASLNEEQDKYGDKLVAKAKAKEDN